MILLSFVVPSFNAEKYLDKVIPSLLVGGNDIEIIIVNDGSKDKTLEKANQYKEKCPDIVKVIDKENGGHGSTINEAIKVAQGLYFKCVDADDWLDKDALLKLLAKIKYHHSVNNLPDLYLTNFVYENVSSNQSHVFSLMDYFPKDESVIGWDKVKNFKCKDFFMMHSLVYRLDILKRCKLHLLEHTFYVDNIFVYEPLYFVKSICYLNIDLYRYYIGRIDQSVSVSSMDKNYAHQFRVFKETMLYYSLDDLKKLNKNHFKHMIHALFSIFVLTTYYSTIGDTKKKRKELNELLIEFKTKNKDLYRFLTRKTLIVLYYYQPFFIKKFMANFVHNLLNKKTEWNAS